MQQVLLRCGTQHCLKAVEQDVKELLAVLLDGRVCWVAFEVFKGETEIERIVFLPLRKFQVTKHALELVQYVIVNHLCLVLYHVLRSVIVSLQHLVSERRDHEELLDHGVHVTNAAQVAEANESARASVRCRNVVPSFVAFNTLDQRNHTVAKKSVE